MSAINTHPDNKSLRLVKLKYAQLREKEANLLVSLKEAQKKAPQITDDVIIAQMSKALGVDYISLFAKMRQSGGIVRDCIFAVDLSGVNDQAGQMIEAHLKHSFGRKVLMELDNDIHQPTLMIKADAIVADKIKHYCNQVISRNYFMEQVSPMEAEVDGVESYSDASDYVAAISAERTNQITLGNDQTMH